MLRLAKIISGGQTGVDRAALDVAIELHMAHGGWCPRGRVAEDGPTPMHYHLCETPLDDSSQRTEWNVRDSDATLLIAAPPLTGGAALTGVCARRLGKPLLIVGPNQDHVPAAHSIRHWLIRHGIVTLNVAGPRESECPNVSRSTRVLLRLALAAG